MRIINFLVVSDSPIQVDMVHWIEILRSYKIDNRYLFDPASAGTQQTLAEYVRFAGSINLPPEQVGLEGSASLRKKYEHSV